MSISQKEIMEFLSYNPDNGLFTWIKSRKTSTKVGSIAGCNMPDGYIKIAFKRRNYMAHRLAWLYVHGFFPKDQLDHINGVRNDNRIVNLRECNVNENQRNRGKSPRNTSGYLGVSWSNRYNKWLVQVTFNGKCKHVGVYKNILDAAEAYKNFAKENYNGFYRENQ